MGSLKPFASDGSNQPQPLQFAFNLAARPAVGGGEHHQGGGSFQIAASAVDGACLAQGVALGVNGGGVAVRHLADVEQMFACLGVALDGGKQGGMGGGVAVSVAEEDGGIAVVGVEPCGGVVQHIARGEQDGDDARAGVELALQQAAAEGGWGIFRLPIFCLPCAEMGVGEAVVVFGGGFAAADGGDEFAVEGE